MTLADLVLAFERRVAEAERIHAQAPVAAVLYTVLEDLRSVDGTTAPPPAPDPPKTERCLTPEEVAALLQVSVQYVYRHQRQLGGVKVGKYLRFPESAIRRRLERPR